VVRTQDEVSDLADMTEVCPGEARHVEEVVCESLLDVLQWLLSVCNCVQECECFLSPHSVSSPVPLANTQLLSVITTIPLAEKLIPSHARPWQHAQT
jgi:hypothetical protein